MVVNESITRIFRACEPWRGELPSHLRAGQDGTNAAADIMAGALGNQTKDAPNDALLRRISEVAIRRVARKRGVAVEAPQTKLSDDTFEVNVTYVDDGRVLDSPEDLTQAFEHAIQTELALKGYDLSCSVTMFRSKDGKTEKIGEEASDEDMFACEICDGLVKESDTTCPHCGAVFEDDGEEEPAAAPPKRGGPPGPGRSGGSPGPKKSGGPPGPKKSGGPPGPKKSGGPPPRSEEERRSPRSEEERWSPRSKEERWSPWRSEERRSWRSPRPKEERWSPWRPKEERSRWPPGPKKGGPPGGPKKGGPGGPPGPKKGGPPGGPKKGGPPGPKRGPPK